MRYISDVIHMYEPIIGFAVAIGAARAVVFAF
jgi:hypothetical protein